MKYAIKGFIPNSLVDWNKKVSAIIFLGGCNFRCNFCSNKELVLGYKKIEDISFEKIKNYLERNKDFIDGVVITGGEPTTNINFINLCRAIKDLGFKLKIDTNGSNPEILEQLFKEKLLDCIAMDVKTRLTSEDYNKIIGEKIDIKKIIRSIDLIKNSGIDYEFRTTVVPGLHDDALIKDIGIFLNKSKCYQIQNFHPENGTLDQNYESIIPFSKKKLEEFKKIAQPFFDKIIIKE